LGVLDLITATAATTVTTAVTTATTTKKQFPFITLNNCCPAQNKTSMVQLFHSFE